MGIEPYLLASSILGVLAQRLVRQICPHCKTSYLPSKEELHELGLRKRRSRKGSSSAAQDVFNALTRDIRGDAVFTSS